MPKADPIKLRERAKALLKKAELLEQRKALEVGKYVLSLIEKGEQIDLEKLIEKTKTL